MKIAETFTSFQGEGHLTGKLMRFIRLAGCSVKQCPLHPGNRQRVGVCDTDWSFAFRAEPDELARQALAEVGPRGWASITGGEPMDQAQDVGKLIAELMRVGVLVNIQTSGTIWVTCPWDWLTVSPKCSAADLVQTFGNELKVVYTEQSDAELGAYYEATRFWNYYLMPLWNGDGSNVVETMAAIRRLAALGQPWELTTQAHKWWDIR